VKSKLIITYKSGSIYTEVAHRNHAIIANQTSSFSERIELFLLLTALSLIALPS
jgi:hypothetical protein